MNRSYAYQNQQQQKGFMGIGELRRGDNFVNNLAISSSNGVVCPKPRRLANLSDAVFARPPRLVHFINQQVEGFVSKAEIELLDDIVLPKEDYAIEKSNFQVASSPPFFAGSPPIRASNPVIQDEQFGNGKLSPLSPSFGQLGSPPSRKSVNGGGYVRVKHGYGPAPVRIEGFNCCGNSRISAVA